MALIETFISRLLITIFIHLAFISALNSQSVAIEIVNYKQLEERIKETSLDSMVVVNFWATWCKPCIEEMPIIENISNSHKNIPIKVLLVSLDFPNQIEKRLIPYVTNNKIKNEVIVLNERNPNDWIPKVHQDWSGAIPATLFIYKTSILFHEGQVNESLIYNKLNSLKL